jgi:hypothetical protein
VSDQRRSVKFWAGISASIGLVVGGFLGGFLGGFGADSYEWAKDRVRPTSTSPVNIHLQVDPAIWEEGNIFGGESYEWVFPLGPSDLRRPPSGACFHRYKWSQGPAEMPGVDARTTRFRLTIQSNTEHAVLLEKVAPVIHRRLPSEEGTHVACPVGGAATNLKRFAIDLDRGTGAFTDGEGTPFPTRMLKFGPQDSEPILVIATATHARFDWTLRLDLIVDGEPMPVLVKDEFEGELFSTTGVNRARTIHWAGNRWLPGEGPPVGHHSP